MPHPIVFYSKAEMLLLYVLTVRNCTVINAHAHAHAHGRALIEASRTHAAHTTAAGGGGNSVYPDGIVYTLQHTYGNILYIYR